MATSPRAMTTPTAGAMGTRWAIRPWMGLEWAAPTSWAWIEIGLELSKNWGLASFCRPAKRKVTPRKSRRGRRIPAGGHRAVGSGDRPHVDRRLGLCLGSPDLAHPRGRYRLHRGRAASLGRADAVPPPWWRRASMGGWRESRWRRPAVGPPTPPTGPVSPSTCWPPGTTPRPFRSSCRRCRAPTTTCRPSTGFGPWPWPGWWPTTSGCTGPTAATSGVDFFFVLSGFLITGLLVGEWNRRQTIGLRSFWFRRARRLLPAVMLLLVVLSALLTARRSEHRRVDVQGRRLGHALLLRQLAPHPRPTSPTSPSSRCPRTLRHTWSLAIEEQFYLVWPLLVLAGLRDRPPRPGPPPTRHSRPDTGAAEAGGLLVHGGPGHRVGRRAMAVLYDRSPLANLSRVYYGTDTRAFELLIGAALALVVDRPARPHRRGSDVSLHVAGPVGRRRPGLAVGHRRRRRRQSVDLDVPGRPGGGRAAGRRGHRRGGPTRRRRLGPAAVGRARCAGSGGISYGIYLWHWPVYVLMTDVTTGLGGRRAPDRPGWPPPWPRPRPASTSSNDRSGATGGRDGCSCVMVAAVAGHRGRHPRSAPPPGGLARGRGPGGGRRPGGLAHRRPRTPCRRPSTSPPAASSPRPTRSG